jgi:hypothetical protein
MCVSGTFSNTRPATRVLLAALIVFAAAVLPACGGLCCTAADEAAMHAAMPCCAAESSLAPTDARPIPPATTLATSALTPPAPLPVAAILTPAATQLLPRGIVSTAHHEPSPPLFLLNAQFLI